VKPWPNTPSWSLPDTIVRHTFSETRLADNGTYAEVTPFATVIRSGFMPMASVPNIVPSRPKPQITSSAIIRTSYLSRIFWMAG
jgi:hypothetical protein